ncbi:MAG: PHP domain-containing protein, partial [Anaerolineae bacterium]|nr:PHP domain-containing protein [Anaerolineae bacterium]
MKVDFHVHTCYSRDSLTSLETIIETCRRRGLDKVAITDHNTIAGALALREMAPELVVVGEEIKTPAGEFIAYFLEEEIPRGLSPQEAIARIRAQGGVVGVSHPLDRLRREAMRWANLMQIIDQVDVLEAFNARA